MNMTRFGILGLAALGLSFFAGAEMASPESNVVTNETVATALTNEVLAAEANAAEAMTRALPKLDGLFGYKLGDNLPSGMKGVANDEGIVTVGFLPKKRFLGFGDYMLYVSPESRKVVQIQASCAVMPGEGPATMEKALRFIEFRFGRKAVAKDADNKVVFFADGDFILVSYRQDRVYINACCDKLMRTARAESSRANEAKKRAEVDFFADDLSSLRLVMNVVSVGETDKPIGIASVFGKKFGEALGDKDVCEALPDGSWCAQLGDGRSFVGRPECLVFGSVRGKRIFRVRAVWLDCCDKKRYERIRRVVEIAMKVPMSNNGENSCRLELGNAFVTLTRNERSGKIALDFSDKEVYARHLDELEGLPRNDDWRDVEAL